MIQEAFLKVVSEPIRTQSVYIVLWRRVPFYGGPEEGGWWGSDEIPEAFKPCASREEAEALAERVRVMAKELTEDAARAHGEGCLSQLAWCEARGIDDSTSVFGEDSGPESYYVTVQDELPVAHYGDRYYS